MIAARDYKTGRPKIWPQDILARRHALRDAYLFWPFGITQVQSLAAFEVNITIDG